MDTAESPAPLDRTGSQRLRWWIGLIIFVLFINLWGLGSHGLFEPDEGRYANMAVEFLEPEHDWLEPTLSDIAHFDKPPLIYWLTGTSLFLFGLNEFAARLPSFIGSLLMLGGVALIGFRLYGEKAAWWAVLICATTIQCWALARLLSPDMLLCGLCTLATGLCLNQTTGRSWWWVLGALLWSAAWWDKATACLVPLLALTIALYLSHRRDLLASLRPFWLLLLILIIGSPWYLIMMDRHKELIDFFFHRELTGRIVGHVDGRKGFPGFHFVTAAMLWLPWWPVAIWKLRTTPAFHYSRNWRERLRAIPFEFVVALFVLTIFSCISSKLVTYTVTGVPWLAIGIGGYWKDRKFSFASSEAKLLISGLALLMVVIGVLPRIEANLGANSSARRVVEVSESRGAKAWICDRFLPGMEFYAGESVYYVDTNNLAQVDATSEQLSHRHFYSHHEIMALIDTLKDSVWLIQSHRSAPDWMKKVLAHFQTTEADSVRVGDFTLWRLK